MYPDPDPDPHPHPGEGVAFEPQLVLFEFLSGMMLRQQQVSLLGTFLAAHERRAPLCHQMLMGAGKTTVLAPLLTLLLAQPGVLVMECVPTSLLHFSRTVLWRAFSCPRSVVRAPFLPALSLASSDSESLTVITEQSELASSCVVLQRAGESTSDAKPCTAILHAYSLTKEARCAASTNRSRRAMVAALRLLFFRSAASACDNVCNRCASPGGRAAYCPI